MILTCVAEGCHLCDLTELQEAYLLHQRHHQKESVMKVFNMPIYQIITDNFQILFVIIGLVLRERSVIVNFIYRLMRFIVANARLSNCLITFKTRLSFYNVVLSVSTDEGKMPMANK